MRANIIHIVLLVLLIPRFAWSQEAAVQDSTDQLVEILSANKGSIVEENGEKVHYLAGDVRLRQKETLFFAKRATNYDNRGQVILGGSVMIVEAGDTLWAERVDYNSVKKIGKAFTKVRLTDGEALIKSESAVYDLNRKWADFDSALQLEDSTIVLESLRGAYDLNRKVAFFRDEVVLYEESSTIFADSLTHYRNSGLTNADGEVAIFYSDAEADSAKINWNELALFGERLRYSRNDSLSIIDGNPYAMQVRHDSTTSDTLGIQADLFRLKQELRSDSLIADGSVILWNREYQSTSDSLVYWKSGNEVDEEIQILQDPVLWNGPNQITGDSLRIILADQTIDSLLVLGNAFVANKDSTSQRINQTRAINLFASFLEGEAADMVFMPSAEAVFFRTDSTDVSKVSAFKVSSPRIQFLFTEGEIDKVKALKNEGVYYEAGSLPDNLDLAGFKWLESLRPRKEEVIRRVKSLSTILAERNE